MRAYERWCLGFGLSVALWGSADAHACGGLFCSSANPVNQAAERIIFAQQGDTVHAVIEIQYEGPARSFSWVLPVPGGAPVEVGVSSKQALSALQQASNPRYTLQTRFESCPEDFDEASDEDAFGDDDAFEPEPDSVPDVRVVAEGSVGPYDFVQLSLDASVADPADVALSWLEENGYDVTSIAAELLGSYLEAGLDLIAFRLTKGTDSGSIRPIALSWTARQPVIPIRPTAVAANDDMGILVWVIGEARAIPTNYFHLELNEAKINWFNPAPTYDAVVSAAADEAGGQGFVTEQSTDASELRSVLFPQTLETGFEALRTAEFPTLVQFFERAVATASYYDGTTFQTEFYDGFLDLMRDASLVPLREGATPEQFVACVSCYFEQGVVVRNDRYPSTPYDPETDPLIGVDVQEFLARFDTDVVEPFRVTQALFEPGLRVTRLYTTLSADEMTVDPAFDFNPDLPPVDNNHVAERYVRCNGSASVTLPQGTVVETDGFTWPISVEDEVPANFRILQLGTSGPGEVAVDNEERIADRLIELDLSGLPNGNLDRDAGAFSNDDDAGSSEDDDPNAEVVEPEAMTAHVSGDGCSVDPTVRGAAPWLGGFGLLVLGLRRWRRRAGERSRD